MSAAQHRKAIVKLLQANAYRHQLWNVFSDFVELAAISISNAVDRHQWEEREARYLQIMKGYEREEVERFPVMFAELVNAFEAEPGDMLGMIFGELELGNAARGQFFTPYEICRLMAAISIDDGRELRARIAENGYVTAMEPACGAGAMIIALAIELQNAGFSYQQHLHVTATDVDSRAVHMAFVQLSLMHIPAVVVLGNTLTLEEREHWYTPAHILGGWQWRLRARWTAAEGQTDPDPAPLQLPPATTITQGDLFAAEEEAA